MKFKILHICYNGSIKNRNIFDELSKDCGVEIAVTNLVLKKAILKKYLDIFPTDTSLLLKDSTDVANYFVENYNKFDYISLSVDELKPLRYDKSDEAFQKADRIFRKKLQLKMEKDLQNAMLAFLDVNK